MCRLWSLLAVAILAASDVILAQEDGCVFGEIDLVFVVDASNSIGFGNFRKLKTFLKDFNDHSSINDGSVRIGMVTYSTTVETEFLLNTYSSSVDISSHISKLKYSAGATNTAGGLNETMNVLFRPDNGDRDDVVDFIVVITDGKSNINRPYTIPYANLLKEKYNVHIYALAIGKELQDFPTEIIEMVSSPAEENYQMLDSYDDLLELREKIFSKLCPIIEQSTVIKQGSPCYEEGKIVEKKCRTFKCIDGKWNRLGFTGCINRGRCYQWNEGRDDDCYNYKCFQKGACDGNLCQEYDFRLVNAGCLVDGRCVAENQIIENTQICANFQCLARNDGVEVYSEFVMISKECSGPDGKCRPIGYTYTDNCVQYECQASQFMGIMQAEFLPVNVACKHGDQCIPFGQTVKEVCDTFICSYDDESMGYELMLESQGCEYNGECLDKGQKRFEESTCTNFVCMFSKRQNRLVLKEIVAGCKGDDGGCTGKGDVVTQKGCIKYQCDKEGNFQLVEAGCEEDGECKAVNAVWRRPGECAEFTCVMGQSDDGSVETNIIEAIECHDFKGNCLKPGEEFSNRCKTFRCKDNGKLARVDAKCEYDGKCYEIGDDWVDRKLCKHVICQADKKLGAVYNSRDYGCKDADGKCYAPGEYYQNPGSCLRNKCYDDHVFRKEGCEYKERCYDEGKDWIDMDDCLSFLCYKDEYTGEAAVATYVYGCLEEGVCKKPGDRYEKDCQTYECMSGGLGFKIVESQCPWRQGCRNVNQTWFDNKTCRKYGCFEDEDGIDIEEITYGCRGMNDECVKDSKELQQDSCIKYSCDNGNLAPTYIGCEFEDGCMNLDEFRVDEEKCIKYKCVMSQSGDGFVATKIREIRGCLDHDKCYFPGAKKEEDCSTFVCARDGTFKLIDPQCPFAGGCKPLNSTWDNEEKCKRFTCVINKKTGLPVVRVKVWGCRHNNRCHKFGAKRRLKRCVTHICEKTDSGPKFVPHKIGCLQSKRCRPLDKSWVNKDTCVMETCGYEAGNMFPEIMQSPYGCFDNDGVCRPFGAKMTDEANPCVKYECTSYGYFSPIDAGCSFNGKCKAPGTAWKDKDTCTKYRCKQENVGPSKVIMHTIEISGCKDPKGICMADGETKRYECTDYLCDTSRGGLVIVGEGCLNNGECKPLGSTWLDPSSCITYQCQYDAVLKDLFIVEKQLGCQDANGECFNKGQKKSQQCNKFVCNAKGNFQVTKAGCVRGKKCYDIDETWQEGCISFTCKLIAKGPNFVETKIIEKHGCVGVDGKCYNPGDLYKDGCLEYECQAGGQFKQTMIGCVGFDGACVLPGTTVDDDCNKYQCDPYSLSLQPVDMACNFNGVCKELNSTWFDKETCLGYKCAYDPQTNDVDIIERISGCQTEGGCVRPGARRNGQDCVSYQCKRGKMVATEIGCEYKGECLPVNEVIEGDCSWITCVIADQGPTFVDTKLVTEHGCWDCFHHCHRVGDEFTHGCKVTECMPGGFTKTIQNRCMTPDGYCINFGESYNYTKGGDVIAFTCGELGDLEKVTIEHKCQQNLYGKKYDIGQEITVDCVTYKCTETIDAAQFIVTSKQCKDENNVCRMIGESWYDNDKDSKYTCTTEGLTPTITEQNGCEYEGNFYENGYRWKEDCATYECVVTVKDNTITRAINLVEGKCKDQSGTCHAVGTKWNEHTASQCVFMVCQLKDVEGVSTYQSVIEKQACRDANGQCREIGESGFEALMGADIFVGCRCGFNDLSQQITFQCQGIKN